MTDLFETLGSALNPNILNERYCFNPNHKTVLCNDGKQRCLSCNLTKISAHHHSVEALNGIKKPNND